MTSRSWAVPQPRSTRPFAWGLPAAMEQMPRSARARPTWVGARRVGDAQLRVCARVAGDSKLPWRSR